MVDFLVRCFFARTAFISFFALLILGSSSCKDDRKTPIQTASPTSGEGNGGNGGKSGEKTSLPNPENSTIDDDRTEKPTGDDEQNEPGTEPEKKSEKQEGKRETREQNERNKKKEKKPEKIDSAKKVLDKYEKRLKAMQSSIEPIIRQTEIGIGLIKSSQDLTKKQKKIWCKNLLNALWRSNNPAKTGGDWADDKCDDFNDSMLYVESLLQAIVRKWNSKRIGSARIDLMQEYLLMYVVAKGIFLNQETRIRDFNVVFRPGNSIVSMTEVPERDLLYQVYLYLESAQSGLGEKLIDLEGHRSDTWFVPKKKLRGRDFEVELPLDESFVAALEKESKSGAMIHPHRNYSKYFGRIFVTYARYRLAQKTE